VGLIDLPAARNGNGRGAAQPPAACPAQPPLAGSVGQLSGRRLVPVADKAAALLWNERIDHLATLIPPPR
jgi:anti-sigma factor RsiW